MTPGSLLVHQNFRFSDGTMGKKFLVVLNDGRVGYSIVAKTTSKNTGKGLNSGCQTQDRYPNFFLPQNSCCLEKDTYVGLDEFFELTTAELLARHFSGNGSTVAIGMVNGEWCFC
jgi:hypothetical protein